MTTEHKPHWIAEIRDSLICGCDPQIFSAGEHGDDCPIVLFDGLVEQLEAAEQKLTDIRAIDRGWPATMTDADKLKEVKRIAGRG